MWLRPGLGILYYCCCEFNVNVENHHATVLSRRHGGALAGKAVIAVARFRNSPAQFFKPA